jgi:hypothetical protein
LRNEGGVGDGWVLLDTCNDVTSKVRVVTCELVCKGGEDVFELPSVEIIPRTEEAGTEESLVENSFRE